MTDISACPCGGSRYDQDTGVVSLNGAQCCFVYFYGEEYGRRLFAEYEAMRRPLAVKCVVTVPQSSETKT